MRRHRRAETDPPEDLTEGERRALLAWARSEVKAGKLPHALSGGRKLREIVDETLDYHRAEGNLKADWLAVVRNRVRALAQAERGEAWWQKERDARERPQERRGAHEVDEGLVGVGPLLREILGGKTGGD